jgi:hypothetical protein
MKLATTLACANTNATHHYDHLHRKGKFGFWMNKPAAMHRTPAPNTPKHGLQAPLAARQRLWLDLPGPGQVINLNKSNKHH